jgi:hypothetical protein
MDEFERTFRGPWRDHGLILVPASYRPRPSAPERHPELNFLRTRLTHSELFGAEPTWDAFFDRLKDIGLRPIMAALSDLNAVLHVRGIANVQDQWVGGTFDADLKDRVERLPDWRGRIVYSTPQALLVMKAALLHSPDRDDERTDAAFSRQLAEVMLMANDLLDSDAKPAIMAAATADDLARVMLPHAIRSTMANHAERYQVAMGRAWTLFTKLAKRADMRASPNFIDLDEKVRALTGLSIEDYFAVGASLALWFFAGANRRDLTNNRKLRAASFFSHTRLNPGVARSILEALTHTYESAKQAFETRQDSARLFAYDFVPFMLRPLYQIDADTTVAVNLAFLESRVSNGVYWLIFDSLSSRERPRLSSFYGQVLETYVRDVLRRTLPDLPHLSQRVFPDFTYPAPGGGESRTTDVVALYPDSAIFFEVTATRLRVEDTLLSGNPASFEEDLEKIVIGKARQLHNRIEDFRAGLYSFGGVTAAQVPKIVPVVVTGESLPVWTATMQVVRRKLEQEGLLQGRGIEPLRIIGVDEVEMLESLIQGGTSLLTILRQHAEDPGLQNVTLRNFLITRYHVNVNQALMDAFREVGSRIARVLFDKASLGGPADDAIRDRAYQIWEQRGGVHGLDLDDWLQAESELEGDALREALPG